MRPKPTKDCVVCGRPMEWRKSWAKNWDQVKYCSDRCVKIKKSIAQALKKEKI